MKKILILLFLATFSLARAQLISEEELRNKVKTSQEYCDGAHESIVLQTNEGFSKDFWGKKVRFNEVTVMRFFNHPSGEKVNAGFNVYVRGSKNWGYVFDQQRAADLLGENGLKVSHSFNTLWITARQDILQGESTRDGKKIILELYCPKQEFLEVLRTGRTQSIEFMITSFYGSLTKEDKIQGVVTHVNTEKQIIKCSNGHEYDKVIGYKFCPKCGEPLK